MHESIHKTILQSIDAAEGLYCRLVLLVGKARSGKTCVLQDIANRCGVSVINVNLTLSSKLLELTGKQQALRLPGILDQVAGNGQSLVVLDNLEILFDKNLKQDPLRLLKGLSRNRTVVASWNGTYSSNRLLYAEAGHPEYRNYDSVDTLIVSMDGATTVDLANNNREVRHT